MNRKVKAVFAFLCMFLVISISTNVVFFESAQRYYLLLNASKLDPLGLSAFADTPGNMQPPLIVFFGDSRAAEWPAPEKVRNATFLNRGIGNQTTAQLLGRFNVHVAPLHPQIIVLQAGINDLKTIPLFPDQKEVIINNCKANLKQIVDLSLAIDARVIVTTIFPLGRVPIERRPFWSDDVEIAINDVNAFIRTLESDNVIVIETNKVLANADGLVDDQYSQDFLHLNPAGYAVLNDAIDELFVP
ncbi:MAG TPA: GDSL-type esterase/lipase family protein [Anaerolineales bacterium]|nr:GDSL-type esterase/lipase family protein [Anaerolineales bacterium]